MKWVLRIFIAALFLLCVCAAVAWLAFPRYAQALIDRAVEGTNISIRVDDPGLPGFRGIPFGRLEVVFDTPPDSCTNTKSTYRFIVFDGFLSWKRSSIDDPVADGLPPGSFGLDLLLDADSVNIVQKNANLTFSDSEAFMTGKLGILRKKGFTPELLPISLRYGIENGTLSVNRLKFEDIAYTFSINRRDKWIQKSAPLSVGSLHTEAGPAPLSNFKAWFGLEKDPDNPCGLTFTKCSVDLFDLKAETSRINYDPLEQETAFTLGLQSLPLEKLPGFQGKDPSKPFATGQLSGTIPVELRHSVLKIRGASIGAGKGTRLMYYSLDGAPWLSIDAGSGMHKTELFRNLNATITFNSDNEKLPGIALKSFSAGFLGGSLISGPATYSPKSKTHSFTFRLENVNLPEHVHLHGDFRGNLKGSISGTLPVSVTGDKYSINNAFLTSKGRGSITHAPPRREKNDQDNFLGSPDPGATYTYDEADLRVSRDPEGKTRISFVLKKMTRATSGGSLELLSPTGTLDLWHVKNNPSMLSLSNFSAGFMAGSVAIDKVDYDMKTRSAQTVLVLNNIPLQKLLDLQGMKKIYATGSIRGTIPVVMKEGGFEIPAGSMDAEQAGKIIYATTPEERTAANESLRFTYEALSNFLYSELLSSIRMTPDGQSHIQLQLKGVNPSFQEGRPVHLNLNVEQNLLDLLKSLTISTSIEEAISEKALKKQLQ